MPRYESAGRPKSRSGSGCCPCFRRQRRRAETVDDLLEENLGPVTDYQEVSDDELARKSTAGESDWGVTSESGQRQMSFEARHSFNHSGKSLTSFNSVVMDCGSGTFRMGYAGEEGPSVKFPSILGREKHRGCFGSAVDGAEDETIFFGADAARRSAVLNLSSPVQDGLVTDWNDIEAMWAHGFRELGAQSG